MIKFLIILSILMISTCTVDAHEGHGYAHQSGSLNVVGQMPCGLGQVWMIDDDGDNKVDRCVDIRFIHGTIHVKQLDILEGRCDCEK